ncbi:universal stress protein [Natronosalvus rutilus]|uniref:Universal stress protein n=1 Tax=Natronosalvus rutilus TaxID=2953753 RepID=A0A9E7NE02_9EURY|nr:universal stress protein [Natronosalvus rutilus]UTF55756.1 universal stress protein [Natronosalvus rutilus]
MYSVLVPIGTADAGVSRAVETIASFPGRDELSVVIVHVARDVDFIGSDGSYVSLDQEDLSLPSAVESAMEAFEDRGISAQLVVREGDEVDEILETINDESIDQVVVPDKRRSPVGKVIFGGTTLSLIRNSPAPVTVVPSPNVK